MSVFARALPCQFAGMLIAGWCVLSHPGPACATLIDEDPGPSLPEEIVALKEAAGEGDVSAMVRLGEAFARGGQVPVIPAEAERWLRLAIATDPDSQEALHLLGRLLVETGTPTGDVDRAAEGMRLLRQLSATHTSSQVVLGFYAATGRYRSRSYEEAESLFRSAAEAGDPDGWFRLGWLFSGAAGFPDRVDAAAAVEALERAFSGGHMEAGRLLVRMLGQGTGVPRDHERAFRIISEASEQGSAGAAFLLARLYADGIGTPADPAKSLASYERCAELGNGNASIQLGLIHQTGSGGIEGANRQEARTWFERAIEQGAVRGHYHLALLLDAKPALLAPDRQLAVEQLFAAANAGVLEAQDRLGSWYRDGRHVYPDLLAARAWFERAAGQGSPTSMINLALMLERGQGGAPDLAAAFALYQRAANAGHPVAHFHLARLFEAGIGGQVDLVSAAAHLSASAEAGLPQAVRSLPELWERLASPQQAAAEERKQGLRVEPWGRQAE